MIVLRDVSKKYRISKGKDFYAIKDINLSINKGEFIAITGKSGAGKSTLLHIIGCIDNISDGSYTLDGIDVSRYNDNKLSEIRNSYFGFVLQDFALINEMTAAENIMIPAYFKRQGLKDINGKIDKMLQSVNMGHMANKKVKFMSGGERQRIAIARALVNDPQVILADEPTGNLDSSTSVEIFGIFKELNNNGKTVISVTHDNELAAMFNKKIIISDGCIS